MVRVESHVELQISPVNENNDINKCATFTCTCYVQIKTLCCLSLPKFYS